MIYKIYNKMNAEQRRDAERKFNKYQKSDISDSDLKKATKKAGNLGDQMKNFTLLLSMIKDSFSGKFNIPNIDKGIIIGAIIYVVSPIDAVPDFIPFIGWLDDIAIVGIAMNKLSSLVSKYKKQTGRF